MTTQIYIKLVNFKCFVDFELNLYEGINYISGNSGVGKTNIIKAIYFCFYGGRKFKNIQNRHHKDKPTTVLIHYQSPSFEWRITRTRPSEVVQVEIRDANGVFIHKDAPAQDWINKQFGVENIWLSSSYIGVTKPHFLIGDNKNIDKLELLQQIAYGDAAPQNQPDMYITAVKSAITFYNERFKQLNDNIRVNEGVKQSYQTRNPDLVIHPYITEEETWKLISQRDNEKLQIEKLRSIYNSLQFKNQIITSLNGLPKYNESIEDVKQRIETLKKQQRKIELKLQLTDFDDKIYTTDINILSSDHFLFNRYISEGWNKINIKQFLDDTKKQLKEYEEQLQIESKNKEISLSNFKKTEINNSLIDSYRKSQTEYHNNMENINKYNKRKEEISKLKESLGSTIYIKLSDEDDMSSSFVYSIMKQTSEKIEEYKLLVKENKKYNSCKAKIEDKFKVLVSPNKIDEEDDMSIDYVNSYILTLSNKIYDYKNKINETNRYNRLKYKIDDIKSSLIEPTSETKEDDLTSKYIYTYRNNITSELNMLIEKKKLIEYRTSIVKLLEDVNMEKDNISFIELFDEDDGSFNSAQEYKIKLTIQLNELTCPHCNHGLLLENGNLKLGITTNNRDISKRIRIDKIEIVNQEINRRIHKDNLNKKIEEYSKVISKIVDESISDISSRISDIETTLDRTLKESEIRGKFFTSNSEITNLEIELSKLNNIDIQDFKSKILEYEESISKCNNEIHIRNSYNTNMVEIDALKTELSLLVSHSAEFLEERISFHESELIIVNSEFEKRMKNDDLNKEISSFEKIVQPSLPDKPNEPELLKLDSLLNVKKVLKPKLEIFDLPIHSYENYLKLWKSNTLKELDKELQSIEVDDHLGTLDDIKNSILTNINLESIMKKVNEERLRYETIISTLPENDPEIENKIVNLSNSINLIESKINLASEMKELKRIETCISQMTSELNTVVEYLGHYNYYYSETEKTGMDTLEQRLNDINIPLKEILDSLFDEPISVKISPFKELKNGNTKLQVNLIVEHGNALIDDYDDECSTGQIGRISIALLLAFARNNNNPFIIIDEVLSSVDLTRQNDILDILPSYGSGKFIINICHGISEGSSNNVIYLN